MRLGLRFPRSRCRVSRGRSAVVGMRYHASVGGARRVARISGTLIVSEEFELQGHWRPIVVKHVEGKTVWVKKPMNRSYNVLAEVVGGLLAEELGLRVPEFAWFEGGPDGPGPSWLSKYQPQSFGWKPEYLERVTNPEDLGGLLALDALIWNEDRNADNILFAFGEGEDGGIALHLWGIDHDAARVGRPADLRGKKTQAPPPGQLPESLRLTRAMRARALDVGEHARSLPERTIAEIAEEAVEIAGAIGEEDLREVLISRCRAAEKIVELYLAAVDDRGEP